MLQTPIHLKRVRTALDTDVPEQCIN